MWVKAYKFNVKLIMDNGEWASYLLKLVIHVQLYSFTQKIQCQLLNLGLNPFEIEVSPHFYIVSVLENGKLHFHWTLLFKHIFFLATSSPTQLSSYKLHIQLTVSGQPIQAIALPLVRDGCKYESEVQFFPMYSNHSCRLHDTLCHDHSYPKSTANTSWNSHDIYSQGRNRNVNVKLNRDCQIHSPRAE